MNKIISFTILLITSAAVSGCAGNKVSDYGDKIVVGSSAANVIDLLGQPKDIETRENNLVLKYCSTNLVVDEMFYVWLKDNKVRQVVKDKNTRGGACSKFLKDVKWEESLASNYLILQLSNEAIARSNTSKEGINNAISSFAELTRKSNQELYEKQQEIYNKPFFKPREPTSTRLKANCLNTGYIITCN